MTCLQPAQHSGTLSKCSTCSLLSELIQPGRRLTACLTWVFLILADNTPDMQILISYMTEGLNMQIDVNAKPDG